MNRSNDNVLPIVGQKLVLAVAVGIGLWLIPPLQHWLVYLVWSPILGIVFVWAYSEYRDVAVEEPHWRFDVRRGLVIGLTHIISSTGVWIVVTRFFSRL